MNASAVAWLVANGVVPVLLGVVLAGWGGAHARLRQRAVLGVVCLGLALVLLLVFFRPAQVETGWITVLQEGRSIRNIRQLYGDKGHPGVRLLATSLGGAGLTTLPAVVHMNLCLAVLNTIIFFFIASYVLQSWWGSLAVALGYACNLNTLHAACSETPAMVWTTYFWLGCIAAAAIDDHEHTTRNVRILALFVLAVLAGLSAMVRGEWLLLGFPAVALGAVKVFGGETMVREAARAAGRLAHAVVAGRLLILLLVVVALRGLQSLPWLGTISYVIDGIAPLNFSFLLLPQKLGIFLPFGFIALFILGVVHTTRRWFAFLLLPITLLILFKAYAAAAQGNFEHFRYLGLVTPVVFFLALFGFRELADWAERWAWPPWWRRLALLVIVLSMSAWQPLGPRELFSRRQELAGVEDTPPLLALNQQTEVRYLLDLVARYPTCVFLVKSPQAEATSDERTKYRWAAFGAPLVGVREMPDEGGRAEEVARQLTPGVQCVLLYRSLDCNLVEFAGCQTELEGRAALEERVLENLPYSDISEYGAHRAEIRLGVYRVDTDATGSAGEPERAAMAAPNV